MLGKTPLVSMSDKRLGGIENSSLRYFSAMRALEISISRMVNPSFSRRVRRLLPAGSMTRLHRSARHHSRARRFVPLFREEFLCRSGLLRNPNKLCPASSLSKRHYSARKPMRYPLGPVRSHPTPLFAFRNAPHPILQNRLPRPPTAPFRNFPDLSLPLLFSPSSTPTPSAAYCARSPSAPAHSAQ